VSEGCRTGGGRFCPGGICLEDRAAVRGGAFVRGDECLFTGNMQYPEVGMLILNFTHLLSVHSYIKLLTGI